MNEANEKNLAYWDNWYANHKNDEILVDDWLDRFGDIIDKADKSVIDLGCGSGNNTLYLLNRGKEVIPCDGSFTAIGSIIDKFPQIREAFCFDMLDKFPIANNTTDLVIADLCLHYFTKKDTINILKEIRRILVNQGNILLRVNSMADVNHGAGEGLEIEHHLYMTSDGRYKRFFDQKDIYEFFNSFDIRYIREYMMKRYALEKPTYVVRLKNRK